MDLTRLSALLRGHMATLILGFLTVVFSIWGAVSLTSFISQGGFGRAPLPANLDFNLPSFANNSTQYSLDIKKEALQKLSQKMATYQTQTGFDEARLLTVAKLVGATGSVTNTNGNLNLKQEDKNLTYDQSTNQLIYSQNQVASSGKNGFDEEILKKRALDFIAKLELVPTPLIVEKINYLGSGMEPVKVDKTQAAAAAVTLKTQVKETNLIEKVVLTIDNQGNIINFSLHPLVVGQMQASYPIKKFTELEADVKAKNVQIISFGDDEAVTSGQTLSAAVFSNIRLGYSHQLATSLLQPVLVMSGQAQLGKRTVAVEAVVPAISGVRIDP